MGIDIIAKEKELVSYSGEDKVISFSDMQEAVDNAVKPVCYTSGLNTLDEVLGGFEGGELITISGETGMGKTLLAQTLTRNFHRKEYKSLWFSFEVMPRNFLKVFGGDLPQSYLPKVLKNNSLAWIEQRVWEAKLKYECRIVFIDHLHFLLEMRTRANMSLEIGHIMRGLKTLAKKYNMIFFLIAHTQKIGSGEEPGVNSIRDSSFVGQESDSVLMVWRIEGKQSVVKVVKNRKEGIIKKVYMYKALDGFLREGESAELSETNTGGVGTDKNWF